MAHSQCMYGQLIRTSVRDATSLLLYEHRLSNSADSSLGRRSPASFLQSSPGRIMPTTRETTSRSVMAVVSPPAAQYGVTYMASSSPVELLLVGLSTASCLALHSGR
jgi:hypothetical protein